MSKIDTGAKDSKLAVRVKEALVLVPGAAKDLWWLRASIPTLIGVLIIARQDLWPGLKVHEGRWTEIITHLGIAFVVSGIVVFGYEWGSDHKKNVALTTTLLNLLNTHVTQILEASDRIAVQNALKSLAGEEGDAFAPHFLSLADSIARLGHDGWTSTSYLRFLEHYLKELTDKAAGLAEMSEKVQSNAPVYGSEYRLLMPDAPKLVDVLVEATMRELSDQGGEYYAVSDASTWDKLSAFRKAQEASLKRIHARRIFVLGRDSDKTISPARVNDILNIHFQQSRVPANRYEMKITSQDEYRRLRIPDLTDAVHFGIWAPTDKAPIAVLAIDDNLSNFRLAPVPPEQIIAFETLWNRLDDLTEAPLGLLSKVPVGEAIIQDHMLAYRVRRMGQGTRYRGVSKMAMWSDGGLTRFFKASIEAINRKEIWIKRIFVFDEPEDSDNRRVLDVIRAHTTAAAETTRYEWRVCLGKDLPEELKPPGIAIFEGDSDDGGQLLSEVAVGPSGANSPARVESQPRTFETRVRIFDDFWETLKFEESIRSVFGKYSDKVFEIVDGREEPDMGGPCIRDTDEAISARPYSYPPL